LIMEILHLMIMKAFNEQMLTRLAAFVLSRRTSLYADDMVTFLRPTVGDFRVFTAIIDNLGAASGLRTNLHKCFGPA
jgi:hypothetical protein